MRKTIRFSSIFSLQPSSDFSGEVSQNPVSARSLESQQRFEHDLPFVEPTLLRGCFQHGILATDLISQRWHMKRILDSADNIQVRHSRFDHHVVGSLL